MRPTPVPALARAAAITLAMGLAPVAAHAQTAGPPTIAPRVAVPAEPARPPVVVGPAAVPAARPGAPVIVAPAQPARPPGAPVVVAPAVPAGPAVVAPARPPVVVPARPPVGPAIVAPAQPARPPGVVPAVPARPFGPPVITPPPPGFQVRVPPPPPRFEPRPMRPGPAHVWIDGYWNWGAGRYDWVPGYWYQQPQPAVEWVAPHWEMRGGAWVFVAGYWRNAAGAVVVLPPPYVTPTPVYPPAPVRVIGVAAIATGLLRAGTTTLTPEGAFADDYTVNLGAGQTITIVLRGGASFEDPGRTLDVVAQVIGNGQALAVDDDGAGYPNSRIVFTAPWSGPFVIRVTTAQPQRQGHYTLQTYAGFRPDQI